MQENFKQLEKEQLLDCLYLHTSQKFPHSKLTTTASPFIFDFYEYSGIFYFYKDGVRTDVTDSMISYFKLTIDDLITAVGHNTKDDFLILPTDRYGVYRLYEKNGDNVERILLNKEKLFSYIRTLDEGFGLFLYPIKRNLWYISVAPIPEDTELRKADLDYIKKISGSDIPYFFKLDSDGYLDCFTKDNHPV